MVFHYLYNIVLILINIPHFLLARALGNFKKN